MAAFEQRDNSGTIFKNDRKQQANHPDYKGQVMVNGVEFWVSGWIKTAGPNSKNPGSKFLSLAFQEKDNGFGGSRTTPATQQPASNGFEDFGNDVPF